MKEIKKYNNGRNIVMKENFLTKKRDGCMSFPIFFICKTNCWYIISAILFSLLRHNFGLFSKGK